MNVVHKKIDLEGICKKVENFRCIHHRKYPELKIQDDSIFVTTCCEKFQNHIEAFIEKQVELLGKKEI